VGKYRIKRKRREKKKKPKQTDKNQWTGKMDGKEAKENF
jgi:hypothetical protein